jgi:hypothetical protein
LRAKKDEEEWDRKQYRREQPLVEDNIKQREEGDEAKTISVEQILKSDKAKMTLMVNPILNAEIFISRSC